MLESPLIPARFISYSRCCQRCEHRRGQQNKEDEIVRQLQPGKQGLEPGRKEQRQERRGKVTARPRQGDEGINSAPRLRPVFNYARRGKKENGAGLGKERRPRLPLRFTYRGFSARPTKTFSMGSTFHADEGHRRTALRSEIDDRKENDISADVMMMLCEETAAASTPRVSEGVLSLRHLMSSQHVWLKLKRLRVSVFLVMERGAPAGVQTAWGMKDRRS
ncbi:hypothetical protein SKAU_G00130260 [Synaphobranchus kaupii]|uniref:Uncharacterized protein n=1 Tax=Synaphobranchus kaupii TaxID=118154 RepID=A0A9Q1FQ92_SYNKA|nr:hypothetical protein SKAU_G00130260 [Synaphobranchus kaupii]